MITTDTVTRLIQGSHNIDLMRKQIPSSFAWSWATSSYDRPHFAGQSKFSFEFESGSCSWKSNLNVSTTSYRVQYWKTKGYITSLIFALDNDLPMRSDNVLMVYRDLKVLLEGLSKEFPELESDLQYLIDASDVVLAK